MSKKRIKIIVFLTFSFILISCQKQEERNVIVPIVKNSKFVEQNFIDFKEKIKPSGICILNDNVIVCEKEKHRLGVYDKQGRLIKYIGKLGDGESEFVEPECITIHKDKVLVLDAGNNTVKIFSQNLDFIKKINLEALDHFQAGYRYIDIAVDSEDRIYVSTDSVGIEDAYIYIIEDGKIEKGDSPFVGYLSEYNGIVYAINSLELYRKADKEGGISGKNYFYALNGKKIKKLGELPYKILASDFCILNDTIYLNSGAWNQLVTCDMEGKLKKSIIEFHESAVERYIIPIEEQEFLISDSKNNIINKICMK